MTSPIIRALGATHLGGRSANEDSFLVHLHSGLFAVADGIGGNAGGEVASGLAIDTLHRFYQQLGDGSSESRAVREGRMDLAFRLAHREVARHQKGELVGMGTTLVALRVEHRGLAVIAHKGDSRCYRLRDGRLDQLTLDHSLAVELERAGVGRGPGRVGPVPGVNVLTRVIGVGEARGHEVVTIDLRPGDKYLLCSDGLSAFVRTHRLASILSAAPLEVVVPALIAEAWSAGTTDNVTAVVVSVEPGVTA